MSCDGFHGIMSGFGYHVEFLTRDGSYSLGGDSEIEQAVSCALTVLQLSQLLLESYPVLFLPTSLIRKTESGLAWSISAVVTRVSQIPRLVVT